MKTLSLFFLAAVAILSLGACTAVVDTTPDVHSTTTTERTAVHPGVMGSTQTRTTRTY